MEKMRLESFENLDVKSWFFHDEKTSFEKITISYKVWSKMSEPEESESTETCSKLSSSFFGIMYQYQYLSISIDIFTYLLLVNNKSMLYEFQLVPIWWTAEILFDGDWFLWTILLMRTDQLKVDKLLISFRKPPYGCTRTIDNTR
jgi:hypothetical protein